MLKGPNGEELPYAIKADDTYECIEEVLLSNKTIRDVTNPQLIYLYTKVRNQVDVQVVAGELIRRLVGEDETKI